MISIVVPTYNREKSLEKCIKSILNQTYTDFELIIVDDCSVDNTEKMIHSFSDNRIKYIKLDKRGGAYNARNAGISVIKGEYFLRWDSDDIMYPFALSELTNILNKNKDIDMVYAPAVFFRNNNILDVKTRESGFLSYGDNLRGFLPRNNVFILIRRKIMDKNNLFLGPNIDFSFYLRLARKAKKVYHLNKNLGEVFLESDKYSETIIRKIPDYEKSIARVHGLEVLINELGSDMSKFAPKRLAAIAYGLSLGEILLNKRKKAIKYSLIACRHNIRYFYLLFISLLPFSNIILRKLFNFRKSRFFR